MTFHLGFTGTQRGLSAQQRAILDAHFRIAPEPPIFFHHGDCIGADSEAHDLFTSIWGHDHVIIHPPLNPKKRAFRVSPNVLAERDYRDRNRDIVLQCNILLACPIGEEELRSGTWMTVRIARKSNRSHVIIYPNGTIDRFMRKEAPQ